MSRMIWKGAISFGLVHVPVQLFPATRSENVSFHLLDRRSMDPVGYRQINKRTGKDVPREQIVRGYEYEKEKYVVLSDDEILAAHCDHGVGGIVRPARRVARRRRCGPLRADRGRRRRRGLQSSSRNGLRSSR